MPNKLPEIGKRYKNIDYKYENIVKIISMDSKAVTIEHEKDWFTEEYDLEGEYKFSRFFEELPDQEPAISKMETTEDPVVKNNFTTDKVQDALEELKRVMSKGYFTSQEKFFIEKLFDASENLVNALEEKQEEFKCAECSKPLDPDHTATFDKKPLCRKCMSVIVDGFIRKTVIGEPSKQETKSIWKPISELPEEDVDIYFKWNNGIINVGRFDKRDHKIYFLDYVEGEHRSSNNLKSFCTLTDFITHQENLEERITKLESLTLNDR